MGVTIYFNGNLNYKTGREKLVGELLDIAQTMDWQYRELEISKENERGVWLRLHPHCEPLIFLFNGEGKLLSPFGSGSNIVFVKTQFAPIEIHLAIIKMLRYIKEKYMSDLDVRDDGQYWETGNMDTLVKNRGAVNTMIDRFTIAFKEAKVKSGSSQNILDQIEEILEKLSDDYPEGLE